ncbi:2'-5' RNA ligase family protein [Paenibacillus sedimenti]|uniref:Putative phosphoesterase ICC18_03695 n=1 Tax=Paenibacillus sedimenti TaxID=2770274 RepID=A0A926KKC1_9BACL|nr:2'-5' RNA ligase family protein [Paenibacillus sedimenti]MBD0379230.1 2'-5' RNA ligase family protein [Paenibacillus sedimenti]
MNCGIAIFPSKQVQDAANSYRKRYDPHYNFIQPHLTIREKEEWDEMRLGSAVDRLEVVTRGIAPFEIEFNRFSSFYPVNNVIYLALSDTTNMENLHNAICKDELAETGKTYSYNPHLTIGQQIGDDELHDVLSSLKKNPVDFRSRVDRVHLLYQTENGAWTVYQTFLLRG